MIDSTLFNAAAITVYTAGAIHLIIALARRQASKQSWILGPGIAALLLQAAGSVGLVFVDGGLNLGFFTVGSLIFWVINAVVMVSGLRKPLHTIFVFLFPMSALSLSMALLVDEPQFTTQLATPIMAHILLSILAYGLLIIATIQALMLAFQNYQLRHKHTTGLIRLLPPLQTMEALYMEYIWVGQTLLTLSIVTGFVFLQDVFAQHLVHKTSLSILAWFIYATLLWGHVSQGWRGYTTIRWGLGGFAALMLAYFGSKFVLEIILGTG